MNNKLKLLLLFSILLLISGCASTGPVYRGAGIDQEPMYGGMDRTSNQTIKAADEKLIAGTSKEFGSREKASALFAEQGIRFYRSNNYSMAMKRFNQAWLLNPSNPDSFWGFAMVYHDEGERSICKAKDMIDKAIELNLSKPISLADGGRVYTLCAITDYKTDENTKREYFKKSDELYKKAISGSPNNDYVYGSWATAYFWRGDYTKSWEMVAKARNLGFTFPGQFINMLRQKQAKPN